MDQNNMNVNDSSQANGAQESGDAQMNSQVQQSGQTQMNSQAQPSGQVQMDNQAQQSGQTQMNSQAQPSGQAQMNGQAQQSGQTQMNSQAQQTQTGYTASGQNSDGLYHYSYINNAGSSRYDRRDMSGFGTQGQSRAYSGFERNVNGMEAWYDSQRMSRNSAAGGQTQNRQSSGMNTGAGQSGMMGGMGQTAQSRQDGAGSSQQNRQSGVNMNGGQTMNNMDMSGGKPEKRAKKRKNKGEKKSGFGMKAFSLIAAAVVFGLVAAAVFQGVRYGTDKLLGNDTTETASSTTTEATTESNTPQIESASTDSSTTVSTTYDVATVAEKVMPSIVSITGTYVTTYQSWFDSYQQESTGCGSGIIIGKDDDYLYIATNYHVVEDSKELSATFVDDTSAEATIKGYVENNDIAVVTVNISDISDDTLSQIKEITVGSSDTLKVGDPCVAIGNALGYGQSVTVGYISALNREISTSDETVTVLQTDAAINPGNSGGALVNMSGELIGINTAKYSDTSVEGMGYALPISDVQDMINDLIAGKSVASDGTTTGQTYLGVVGQTITSQYSQLLGMPEGVYVSSVEDGSAAEECGLQSGDIICSLDGEDVTDMDTFHDMIVSYNAGDKVTIVFYRNNNGNYEKQTVTATLQAKE